MTDTENKSFNITHVIIGAILGGLIIYFFLKSSNNTQKPPFPQQLQLQQPQQLQQLQQPTNMLYKNNESWEIIRGKDGFISRLNVLRDVKLNN